MAGFIPRCGPFPPEFDSLRRGAGRRRSRARARNGSRLLLERLEPRQLLTVAIANPLVAAPIALEAVENQDTGLRPVATFTDPGNRGSAASAYAAQIQWGDGSSSPGTITGPDASGVYTVGGRHIYTEESSLQPPDAYPLTVTVTGGNLIQNGGFEQYAIPAGTFAIFPSIPGWTKTGGPSSGIELQNHVAGSPDEGEQFAELASDSATAFSQDVATVPGQQYLLSFEYSPRPGIANNPLNITWDGQTVAPGGLNSSGLGQGDTSWHTYTYTVSADPTSRTTRLTFDDLNAGNTSYGT
jgi:hypothetical protein